MDVIEKDRQDAEAKAAEPMTKATTFEDGHRIILARLRRRVLDARAMLLGQKPRPDDADLPQRYKWRDDDDERLLDSFGPDVTRRLRWRLQDRDEGLAAAVSKLSQPARQILTSPDRLGPVNREFETNWYLAEIDRIRVVQAIEREHPASSDDAGWQDRIDWFKPYKIESYQTPASFLAVVQQPGPWTAKPYLSKLGTLRRPPTHEERALIEPTRTDATRLDLYLVSTAFHRLGGDRRHMQAIPRFAYDAPSSPARLWYMPDR